LLRSAEKSPYNGTQFEIEDPVLKRMKMS